MTIASLNIPAKHRCSAPAEDGAMHVGQRIKKLMREKSLSTEAAAFHCGVTAGAVSNWFSTGHIARDNLVAIADLLGESVRYLLTGDERDRELSAIEAEFARRDVPEGTRSAILTLLRACPVRAPAEPENGSGETSDEEHYRRATRPMGSRTPSGSRRKGG